MSPSNTPSVAQTFAGRHLLVTGVTGFVGKVFLSQLLYELPDIGRVDVLVRRSKKEGAAARFNRIAARSPVFRPLRERHGAGYAAFLSERVRVLEGDVTEPLCGLSDDTVAELAPSLDAIVHFAGLTDFDADPKLAVPINVDGALHVAELAAKTEHAAILHTSTCFVAGVNDGAVPETLTPGLAPNQRHYDVDAELETLRALAAGPGSAKDRVAATRERARELGWLNVYTYTKGVAEHLLARAPVEVAVVRPAIVECALHYPFTGWNEGLNTTGPLLWLLRSPFRFFPARAKNHFDVVPVDAVSRAVTLALAALLRGEAERVYQVSTSSSNPMRMGRAIELANLSIRKDLGRGDASRFERMVIRFLDTVPVDADADHAFALPRLQRFARGLKGALEGLPVGALLPRPAKGLEKTLDDKRVWAGFALEQAEKGLGRLQRMLDLYRPFIHDHDWIFGNQHTRDLDRALSADERATWGNIADGIDWRVYWLDILYPGLKQWCWPLLDGGDAPEDPADGPPLVLVAPERALTPKPPLRKPARRPATQEARP
ncbi:MAG: SDR family oxidoreductase [Deltaproteobacteria bacterium]|nr:SDR family oxidoreductase [Deltaproteobacteria bacterium]